jgi:hypothetical protein
MISFGSAQRWVSRAKATPGQSSAELGGMAGLSDATLRDEKQIRTHKGKRSLFFIPGF